MRGRIRTIKPESLTDEGLWDLETETGLPVFRAYVGMWMYADREGRFEWRPRPLKAAILPYWEGDFSRVLDALATRGFVVKYACGGREYGVIPSFKRHQVINNREQQSEIPAPPDTPAIPNTPTREPRVTHAGNAPPVHAQAEGKGREGKGTDDRRVTRAPADAERTDFQWVEQGFSEWRRKRGQGGWRAGRRFYADTEAAAETLREAADARASPMAAIVSESLRAFERDERAKSAGYPVEWWLKDPGKYLGARTADGPSERDKEIQGLVDERMQADRDGDDARVKALDKRLERLMGPDKARGHGGPALVPRDFGSVA